MSIFDIICTVIGIASGIYLLVQIIRSIRNYEFGLDILALVAIVATLLVEEYLASVVVVIMTLTGEFLEEYAGRQAQKELAALVDRTPNKARRVDGEQILASQVVVGDKLQVLPGEMVPVDGQLLTEAVLDESQLTGESLPVSRTVSEDIRSGSIANSLLEFEATHSAIDSTYQRIGELVSLAKESKSPTVRMANTVAIPFTIVSLLIAVTAWLISQDPTRFAEVLVLATPCPLLIAAPVAFLAGLSRAAKSGIIIKGGSVLERLARVQLVAFDKTGTVTYGNPTFDRVEITQEGQDLGYSSDFILRVAASVESLSNHILAKVIVEQNQLPIFTVENLKETFGRGVSGDVIDTENSRTLRVFAQKPAHDMEINPGETVVEIQIDGYDIAHIILVDHIRNNTASSLNQLRKMKVKHFVMLTGDKLETAQYIANLAGITTVHSGLLPHQKYEILNGLKLACKLSADCSRLPSSRKSQHTVAMVGDGVNDAPVLMAADVGIALGGAKESTAATQSADVVIMQDNFALVPHSFAIAKRTMQVAKQSMIGGITLSIVLMIVAAFGFIPAVIGALLQEVLDVIAIVNSVRANFGKATPQLELPLESEPATLRLVGGQVVADNPHLKGGSTN